MAEVFDKKEKVLSDIDERLKEEKYTRAAIENYSVKNFVELDGAVRSAIDENFKDDLKALCVEHLKQTQRSIVGLYIIGLLSLEESSVDDTHLPEIVKIFLESKKYKIAEFLAEKILSYRESKFALKTLEGIYEAQGQTDELFNIKKRLVLIDSKDADNANYLGEYYEKEGDKDLTMFYYRLAIERYIKSRSVKKVEELWNRMIKMVADDSKFIATIASKIRDVMGDEKVGSMVFDDVVKPAMKDESFKLALEVLKVVVNYKPADKGVRKALEECYRNIYADHSQLEKYLKASAIGQSWKPYKEAIRIFESHIAFDNGSYVSHKNWGIGLVKDISNDRVVIDFDGKLNHTMSLEIALRALNVLDDDNIVIWKKFKLEELKKLLAEDPLKVIGFILRSQGGEAASKDIKATLVPDALTEREWTSWWTEAKKAMEASNSVVMSLTKRNVIELRDTDVTVLEELVSRFKKTTNFDNKVKLLIDYKNRGGEINEPGSAAIASYFIEILQASSENSERKVIAYCSLRFANYTEASDNLIDASVLFSVKSLVDLYNNIDIDLKEAFLSLVQRRLKDWDVRYGEFVVNTPITRYHNKMIKILIDYSKFEVVNSTFSTIINRFQEDPEAFLWAAKIVLEDQLVGLKDNIGIRDSEIILRLITLLDILNNEIEQKSNIGRNKKVMSGIHETLFKKNILGDFIESADEFAAASVYSLLKLANTLEAEISADYEERLLAKYPQLREAPRQERVNIRHPFLVTRSSVIAKQDELKRIVNEEIPQNSMAIGEAMEKGDLRENAEYKAALEKQDQLKAMSAKLETELGQVKIIDKKTVDTSIVDVGTKVTMEGDGGSKETYSILGQWSVNSEKGIISYHSPLGKALLDKKVGDEFSYDYAGDKKKYKIISIELADFD